MLDPESLVGGDALAQFALILAVPVRAHRNREIPAPAGRGAGV